ncbi:retropepsin-like aspartic protease family protein [Yoonia vestfoldensis]|uniref:Gag-polyprotein putative aspartyl protease n=1 Tax=Yoonia vestfoldensis TaxID=245188 RepID=A0A1Y0EC38_9RHOB|nr:TIGR02281 family clan AA aspartic protease [Yoonia vestfoldensis]ARU00932.1 gag-polyprotein putative aspartyl protease [Yoonia vestfoldensis]
MTTDQIMQLTYLVLLGAAIGGSAIVAGRNNLGRMAQQAAIWALIFIGVIGAYGLWGDISQNLNPRQATMADGRIVMPRGQGGHYLVEIAVNGTPVRFVVDTGASQVVLSQSDARRIGLAPETLRYSGMAATANGMVRTAPVTLDSMTLGGVTDGPIQAVVNGGEMEESLLGMTYLGLYQRIEIANGTMVLTR